MTTKAIILGGTAAIISSGGANSVFIAPQQTGKTAAMERRFEVIESDLPDRLCLEQNSRFFSTSCSFVGCVVNGEDSSDVVEYCASERWVRLAVRDETGKIRRDRERWPHGLLTTRLDDADVKPYWRKTPSRQVRRALRRLG